VARKRSTRRIAQGKRREAEQHRRRSWRLLNTAMVVLLATAVGGAFIYQRSQVRRDEREMSARPFPTQPRHVTPTTNAAGFEAVMAAVQRFDGDLGLEVKEAVAKNQITFNFTQANQKESGNTATFELALVNGVLRPLITVDPVIFSLVDKFTGILFHEFQHWYQWKHKLIPVKNFYGLRSMALPLSKREFRARMFGEADATLAECEFRQRASLRYSWRDCDILSTDGLAGMARRTAIRNLSIMPSQSQFERWIDELAKEFAATDGEIPDLTAATMPREQLLLGFRIYG